MKVTLHGNFSRKFKVDFLKRQQRKVNIVPDLPEKKVPDGDLQLYMEPLLNVGTGEITGYEAVLLEAINFSSSEEKEDENGLFRQELRYRQAALTQFLRHDLGSREKEIFLNVNPFVIRDPGYRAGTTRAYANEMGVNLDSIRLCFSETAILKGTKTFTDALINYRSQGYKIVIRDFGNYYGELDLIWELKPDFIKVSPYIVKGIDSSQLKKAYLGSLKSIADSLGIKIIIDGVNNLEELEVLEEFGIDYLQGPILSFPQI